MRKAFKRINAMFALVLFTSISAFGLGSATADAKNAPVDIISNAEYSSYKYLLDSYDINVVVNENNTFDVTEHIGAYFNVPKHGISRSIPLKNKVKRLDGTTSVNRAKVTNIRVDAPFTKSISDGKRILKIGDEGVTLTGAKNYTINYNYNIGRDTGKGYDELYFNLIGNQWDTVIGGVSFTVTMPKKFDAGKLGFSKGMSGSTGSAGIVYQVNGNVITGRYNGVLNAREALTVRLELPEGYFVNATYNLDLMTGLSLFVPILFLLLSVYISLGSGKNERVVETVEFYPPKGFNSAEIGFLYKGRANKKDVISLLIYLANKGYIKITELEEQSSFRRSKSFKVIKLKKYDGDVEIERMFLAALFRKSKKVNITDLSELSYLKNQLQTEDIDEEFDVVTSADLKGSFYATLNNIVRILHRDGNKSEYFEESLHDKGFFVGILIAIIYMLMTVKPLLEYNGDFPMLIALLVPGIGFIGLFIMVFGKTDIRMKLFGLVWGLSFGGIPWVLMVLPALLADPMFIAAYIVGLVCAFIMGMIAMFKIVPKRSAHGKELLGKIKGFKTFLEVAEKPKLEQLVWQDPAYFYNILPYTYVLGVSDKWIKKFEVIALQPPDWYAGSTTFNMATFNSFMNTTMASAGPAISFGRSGVFWGGSWGSGSSSNRSSSRSSSSGRSSGGGSSGGGSGGGGGGSW